MTKNFRIAIIGAGMISRSAHLPVALALENVEVVAIVDSHQGRARDLAREFGLDVELPGNVSGITGIADGAIIATPNHTHRDLAIECLDAGISVLVEKPLADSAAAAREIVSHERKSRGIVAVGYVSRFRDNVQFLHRLLQDRYFGRVRRFHHQFGTAGGWSPESAYYLQDTSTGNGVLTVSGTHFLDRMLLFWGYPDSFAYEDDGQSGTEANCRASFSYNHNSEELAGTVRYSKTTYLPTGLVLDTEKGIVVIEDSDDAEILLFPHDSPETVLAVREPGVTKGEFDPFEMQMLDFADAASTGSKPMVDSAQGLLSVQLLEDMYTSKKLVETDWYPHSTGREG